MPNRREPSRTDALKNREQILRAAHEAFTEDGASSLNLVAKRAGVGPGTLYRHFPTREDLVLAVYRRDIEHLVNEVDDFLADDEPLAALRTWFETLAAYVRVKHGLGEALHSAAARDVVDETYAPVISAVARLLSACQEDGSLRPDLDPADVLLLMGFLWRVSDDREGADQARRVMDLAINGMKP
ncbi:TetR/AcrR family transcriptional regulator [Myceligenerans indicum]|uniref:TetR/AcrR family transcriptional regulator n=1 Tax=Myceligenerans indicum TaxID=2593663 RepID=A0ABS1LMK8_9MICO|nr:TetR/AcrR family transcriptional regulator [Myceligenerans indicum]MBL0887408.1 TetR/AcrR family transcriptional regulator [Myceligenerans indicum]